MSQLCPVFKREFLGYFRSPVAYVFLIVFLVASVGLAFFVGGLFKANQASLQSFFVFHPWLYLFLIPAVGMRLWAEERRGGTIELLFTLPITTLDAVLGKFLAAWAFLALGLVLTFPLALTIGWLGDPDWGTVLAGYLGSALMAGAYLAVCSLLSALTKNQVIAFVLGVVHCLVLVFLGWSVFNGLLSGFLPVAAVDFIANLGFIPHFDALTKGIIDPRDLAYFGSLIALALTLNVVVLER
ncbi:MAG: ABC transporter permease [Verrucomicrobia bacterium]|nr:ABC transporter permease [Verrucomicrobiota bacterium]